MANVRFCLGCSTVGRTAPRKNSVCEDGTFVHVSAPDGEAAAASERGAAEPTDPPAGLERPGADSQVFSTA